jgi:hypothetical protein
VLAKVEEEDLEGEFRRKESIRSTVFRPDGPACKFSANDSLSELSKSFMKNELMKMQEGEKERVNFDSVNIRTPTKF